MTEKEKQRKIEEYKKRIRAKMQEKLQRQKLGEFRRTLEKDDPKAFAAMTEYNVRSRSGESPADIAGSYSPEKTADMRRYIDAASAFRRTLID